ncbi:MAG: PAS domain S-box protein [Chloroflexota bacterium]|nr:PAS domain S-box protein [Chloroflexota bacterium]
MLPDPPTLQPHHLGIGRLFDRIQDAVVVVDVATERIVLWNPAATALFGYPLSAALGLPLERLVPPALRQRHLAGLAQYRATGRGAIIEGGVPVEVPALHQDGTEISVELSLSPLADVEVDGSFVLAIIRDITARKHLEAERTRRDRLAGALLAMRTAEHELFNQLAAVSGAVELLSRDPGLPPHLGKRALLARDRIQVAAATLRQLQSLTRLEETDWGRRLDPTIDLRRSTE